MRDRQLRGRRVLQQRLQRVVRVLQRHDARHVRLRVGRAEDRTHGVRRQRKVRGELRWHEGDVQDAGGRDDLP